MENTQQTVRFVATRAYAWTPDGGWQAISQDKARDLIATGQAVDVTVGGFIAITLAGDQTNAVKFSTMADLYLWEDAHPEVEIVSTMPLVSPNYVESRCSA